MVDSGTAVAWAGMSRERRITLAVLGVLAGLGWWVWVTLQGYIEVFAIVAVVVFIAYALDRAGRRY